MSVTVNHLSCVENFSLTLKMTEQLSALNHSGYFIIGMLGSRILGAASLATTALADSLIHAGLGGYKIVTGVIISPYNLIISHITPNWRASKELEFSSALIHLTRVVESLFTAAILPVVCLFNPDRAYQFMNHRYNQQTTLRQIHEQALIKELSELTIKINELQKANALLKDSLLAKEGTEENSLQSQLESKNKEREEVSQKLEELKLQTTQQTEDLQTKNQEIEHLKLSKQAIQEQLEEKNNKYQILDGQVNELSNQIQVKERECQTQQEALKIKNQEINQGKDSEQQLLQRLKEVEHLHSLTELSENEQINALRKQLETKMKEYQTQDTVLQTKIQENEKLKSEQKHLTESIAIHLRESKALIAQKDILQSQIHIKTEELLNYRQLNQDNEKIKREDGNLRQQIENYAKQVQMLSSQITEIKKQLEEVLNKNKAQENNIGQLKNEKEQLSEQNTLNKSASQKNVENIKHLTKELADLKNVESDKKKLEKTVIDLRKEVEELKQDVSQSQIFSPIKRINDVSTDSIDLNLSLDDQPTDMGLDLLEDMAEFDIFHAQVNKQQAMTTPENKKIIEETSNLINNNEKLLNEIESFSISTLRKSVGHSRLRCKHTNMLNNFFGIKLSTLNQTVGEIIDGFEVMKTNMEKSLKLSPLDILQNMDMTSSQIDLSGSFIAEKGESIDLQNIDSIIEYFTFFKEQIEAKRKKEVKPRDGSLLEQNLVIQKANEKVQKEKLEKIKKSLLEQIDFEGGYDINIVFSKLTTVQNRQLHNIFTMTNCNTKRPSFTDYQSFVEKYNGLVKTIREMKDGNPIYDSILFDNVITILSALSREIHK